MYKTNEFVFKNEMIEHIANYYSGLGEALSDAEYDELVSIYGATTDEEYLIDDFKDFKIYRLPNGNWKTKRKA